MYETTVESTSSESSDTINLCSSAGFSETLNLNPFSNWSKDVTLSLVKNVILALYGSSGVTYESIMNISTSDILISSFCAKMKFEKSKRIVNK